MESDSENVSLRSFFESLQEKFYRFNEDSVSKNSQEEIYQIIQNFLKCQQMIYKLAIFSPNEELEDVSTTNLRYLLVHYYIGELYSKLSESRILYSRESLKHLQVFLLACDQLKLVNKEDRGSIKHDPSKKEDANAKRMQKISRFKREKESKKALQELLEKNKNTYTKKANGYITRVKEDEDEDEDDDSRKILLAVIQSAILKALTSIDMNLQELEMLVAIEKKKDENGGRLPVEPPKPAPFKNFTIMPESREQAYRDVFRMVNPATMTPEQWAEEQMALGLLPTPEGAQKAMEEGKKAEKEKKEREMDELEEDTDAKTLKDRNWDDWKDDHPRGALNKNDHYFKRS